MKLLMFAFGCLCITAGGQQDKQTNPVLLDARNPSVYLEYDHDAEREPVHPGEGNDGIWASIHNNTRWAICIRTQSLYIGPKVTPLTLGSGKHVLGIRNRIEIAPLYFLEEKHESGFERVPLTWPGDVSADSWTPSGGTALMSIPKQNLRDGRRVALPFTFEWESEGDRIAHEAYFYSKQIPSGVGRTRPGSSAELMVVHEAGHAQGIREIQEP